MKIKGLIIAAVASLLCNMAYSQETVATDSLVIANEDSCDIQEIQSAIDALMLLAESAESNDIDALRKAKETMEKCNLAPFGNLLPEEKGNEHSLEGHLVFNVAFADSLIQGKDAYKDADSISKIRTKRGQVRGGQILTKTILVKAKGKAVYTFKSQDRQELSVVAEPKGLITTRVHAVNKSKGIDQWHNDTKDVAKGRNSRKASFTLPHSPRTDVTLEITNCTNKDITVVVISN